MGLFGFRKKFPKQIFAIVHEAYEDEEYDLNPIVRIDQEIMDLIDEGVNDVYTTEPDGYFVKITNEYPIFLNLNENEYRIEPIIRAKCFPLESSDENKGKKISFEKQIEFVGENGRTFDTYEIEFTNLKLKYNGIGIIRINQTARKNLRVDLHKIVHLENIRASYAEKIVVTPLKREHQNIREEFVKSELFGRIVFKDLLTSIFWGDTEIPLKIIGVLPIKIKQELALTVNEFTICDIAPKFRGE